MLASGFQPFFKIGSQVVTRFFIVFHNASDEVWLTSDCGMIA